MNLLFPFPFKSDLIGTPVIPTGYIAPSDAPARIAAFFGIVITFCAIVATFFFMKGGLDYIMSGGDPGKVKTGMATLQYSIMGLIVVGIAFAVLQIVKNLLGIGSLDLNF